MSTASASGGRTTERRSGASKRASAAGRNGGGATRGRSSGRGSGAGSRVITDPEEIRQWAEERGAKPACVRGTGDQGDIGVLRLDFPGYTGEDKLETISWDDFFEKFHERQLSLLVQDKTARGQKSNFNKIVSRETAASAGGSGRSRRAR